MKITLKLILLVSSIGVVIFTSLVGAALVTNDIQNFNFNVQSVGTSNQAWAIGGLTILGVMVSIAVDGLRAQKQDAPLNFRAFFQSILYPQTFIALCVSPVVFFGALLTLDGKDIGPSVWLASFQNGFFWQRILDARKE